MSTSPVAPERGVLLEVTALRKTFQTRGWFAPTRASVAARDVSFRIGRGEAVALVGESGSGKSTIARLLLRLERPDGGAIRLDGTDVLASEPGRASPAYRARVQMVFQDPFGSLNPVHRVAQHLEWPLARLRSRASGARAGRAALPGTEIRRRALEMLRTVGLDPPEEFVERYPHELSGGQRQRVAIARALAVGPDLLVADEPTSMLDVSIRMGVLNLLARLKRERGLAILLITHDLASARYLADRILVLYRGRVVEDGPSEAIVTRPAHPYTRALLAAIDGPGTPPAGGVPAAIAAAAGAETGCPFAPRCPERIADCLVSDPEARVLADRSVRCHLYPATTARGARS